METFNESAPFRFNPNAEEDDSARFSAILEIFIHHARNIHNICIYGSQDVYSKFSLTYNPDQTISTRVINGGGKNPDFNQSLEIQVTQLQSILKCEIWMLSRAHNILEDQLLGFALVPLSSIKGKITNDFTLSSTDLFHSPAGTVRLTLSLITTTTSSSTPETPADSSEIVFLDRKIDQLEYSMIDFPDITVITENQKMVSEYFIHQSGSFLRLGASSNPRRDDEPEFSTITSLTDDSHEKFKLAGDSSKSRSASVSSGSTLGCPDTPTSKKDGDGRDAKEAILSVPLRLTDHDAEQSAMQQQVVDMYMRSMQQFTESLASMKLPLALESPKVEDEVDPRDPSRRDPFENGGKKDGSRVFYGSRAFF